MKPYIIPNDDRDYTDTIKFQKKKQKWKESGMSEKDIEKLTNLYHNFDVWGNDKGCNYSNSTKTNAFCLGIILCNVSRSFDYLIYPYYPAYTS